MRSTTKLKKILEKNTVGISFSDTWELTVLNFSTKKREQFTGKTFSEMIGKAYAALNKKPRRAVDDQSQVVVRIADKRGH